MNKQQQKNNTEKNKTIHKDDSGKKNGVNNTLHFRFRLCRLQPADRTNHN